MTGFNKVMRFCNTLQDYESAKNQGTITDDLFVVILQDKLAKFKGQTFDWSQNADLTALATKGELEALAEEIASNERVWAEALNDLNERINEIGTGGGGGTSDIVVDAALSTTSTNAIQNKAVANALNEKADASALASKQDTLVSGTNIKTFNGESILGSGNISISVPTVDAAFSSTSTNAVQNKVVKAEIDDINGSLDELISESRVQKIVSGIFPEIGGLNRDGSFRSTTAFLASDFIEVNTDLASIEYNCYMTDSFNLLCVAFYNQSKSFIEGVATCLDETRTIAKEDMPNGTAYVRISSLASRVPKVSYYNVTYLSPLKEKTAELMEKVDELEISAAISTERCEDILDTLVLPFSGPAYEDILFPKIIKKGMRIENLTGQTAVYLKRQEDGTNFLIKVGDLPLTLEQDIVAFQPVSQAGGTITISGLLESSLESQNQAFASSFFLPGGWGYNTPEEADGVMRTPYIPCKYGDVIRGKMRGVNVLNKDKSYIDVLDGSEVTINKEDAAFCVITVYKKDLGSMQLTINGSAITPHILQAHVDNSYIHKSDYPYADFSLETSSPKVINDNLTLQKYVSSCILGLWIKNGDSSSAFYMSQFRYRQQSSDWNNTEYSSMKVTEVKADGSEVLYNILEDRTSASINDDLQVFETDKFLCYVDWRKAYKGKGIALARSEYNRLDSIITRKEHNLYLMMLGSASGQANVANLSTESYIALPVPQLAIANIVANNLPTSKTDDIIGTLEFNDMQGNVFSKKIIINAQGNSSLGLAKKNFSIDIMDENYDDSHELKFGDWVAQDGFHLKSYMLDGTRVKPMACYDIYENMLKTRGVRKDRAWKRLQLPATIPLTSNEISDSYLQLDDGAKNHPVGFPVIVYFNGIFYGIYCWQLKKHRKNYHQKKDKAAHIHLDGNISNTLFWNANGAIDWDKWAGKVAESDTIANYDGIEVRNPKKLILVDGSEYDADTNAGELISSSSAGYDASNADMVRTASVRASIENLSRRVYSLTQMANGSDKKNAIAEVFDVDSVIDYIIFGQITGNLDGYKKNWQWVTYDGVKWAVNAYDLDGTWGWTSWSYYMPYNTWIHNDTPPVTLVIENYLDEIKARYKELRDNGVIELAKIMQPLAHYVRVIGIDYYDMEYEKWPDGSRDNLWRFEAWMEECIKRTDTLMGYTK